MMTESEGGKTMKTQNVAASKFLAELKALLAKHKVYISSGETYADRDSGEEFGVMTFQFIAKDHSFQLNMEEIAEAVKP